IPSTTSSCESVSAPPPPYFSGNATPIKPRSPNCSTIWRGNVASLSQADACGLISRSAKSASVSRICRCSSLTSKFIAKYSVARLHVLAHPLHDILGRSARRKDLLDPKCLELARILVGDDAAAEDRNVARAALGQQANDLRKQRHVSARQNAQADRIDVLLHRRLRDHLGRLMQSRIDHFEAAVAQCARDDLRAAIVTVEARLRHQNA